jgi:hypothetical protein
MSDDALKSELPQDFSFSQSSLQDYTDCPRRFQLRYLEKLSWPAVETEPVLETERRQQEGLLFHRLAQQYLIGLPVETLTRLANTPDISRWWQNYLKAADLRILRDSGSLATELTLAAPVGKHRLVAKYDLVVVKPDGGAIIYDWKTYLKRPKDEWMAARMQTRVYRTLLIQAGATINQGKPFQPEQIEMIYWYTGFPLEPAHFPYTGAQYKRDWDALVGIISEIGHHVHFPLTQDEKKCSYCPYRSYCNRGEKAGNTNEMIESEGKGLDINFEQIAEIEY